MPYLPLELTMRQPEQIALLKRLLHFVETKTTCMAETPYRNPVTTYTGAAAARAAGVVPPRATPDRLRLGTGQAR